MNRPEFLHAAAEAYRARTPDAAPVDRVGLLAQAGHFTDLVTAYAPALPFADAVVIEGDAGVVVAHRGAYAADRVALEARAGEVTSVITGTDLLGQPESAADRAWRANIELECMR